VSPVNSIGWPHAARKGSGGFGRGGFLFRDYQIGDGADLLRGHRSPYSLPFRARESKRRQSGGVPIDLRDLLAPAGRRCGCWPPAAFSV